MRPAPSTKKIILYHFLTGGLYFLVWCRRLGNELTQALRRKAAPSLWWFAIPGGGYYYIWQLSQSLHIATAGRIKSSFTFLAYVIALNVPFSIYPALSFSKSGQSEPSHDDLMALAIYVVVAAVTAIVAHGVYCVLVQDKVNAVRRGGAAR